MESIDQTVTEDISAHVTMLQDVDILDNVLQEVELAVLDRIIFYVAIYIFSQ